ncbi:hypothetical protein BC827DRAFT_908192 [Russula dissimulans]|nr:hypothetical protein BC827DRAFT_908192 [Russula dissimulans]
MFALGEGESRARAPRTGRKVPQITHRSIETRRTVVRGVGCMLRTHGTASMRLAYSLEPRNSCIPVKDQTFFELLAPICHEHMRKLLGLFCKPGSRLHGQRRSYEEIWRNNGRTSVPRTACVIIMACESVPGRSCDAGLYEREEEKVSLGVNSAVGFSPCGSVIKKISTAFFTFRLFERKILGSFSTFRLVRTCTSSYKSTKVRGRFPDGVL